MVKTIKCILEFPVEITYDGKIDKLIEEKKEIINVEVLSVERLKPLESLAQIEAEKDFENEIYILKNGECF